MLINMRAVAVAAFGMILFGPTVGALDLSRYRNFELGSNLDAVSSLTAVPPAAATTVHQRPALLQSLDWRPSSWIPGSIARSTDPVEHVVFSFYNNRLYRIAVDYDPDLTEGMTDADMVEGVSAAYGTALKRAPASGRATSDDAESGTVVARWGDATYGVALYRTSLYRSDFRLIVTDRALDGLAQKAADQAVRLDAQEAPGRTAASQKKQQDDSRAADEKARVANKGGFRP